MKQQHHLLQSPAAEARGARKLNSGPYLTPEWLLLPPWIWCWDHKIYSIFPTADKAFQRNSQKNKAHNDRWHQIRSSMLFLLKNQQAVGKIWRKLKGGIKSRERKCTGTENHEGRISRPRAGKLDEKQFYREQFNSSYCTHCTCFGWGYYLHHQLLTTSEQSTRSPLSIKWEPLNSAYFLKMPQIVTSDLSYQRFIRRQKMRQYNKINEWLHSEMCKA